jgi:hypothetical protein
MVERTIPFQTEQRKNEPITERSDVRHFPSSQEVYCQPVPASTADGVETGWWGKLDNISFGGLAVRVSRPFEPGTQLVNELSDKTKRRTRSIGREFIRPLAEDQVKSLVGTRRYGPLLGP